MGDVAMTAPVLREFTAAYPEVELLVLSRPAFEPFFQGIPNISFHQFHPKGNHKGFLGLLKLFFELKKHKISAVADLHNNLRSRILSIFFFLLGIKVRRLDKDRKGKAKLTRQIAKQLIPLMHTADRYAVVFNKLGFPFTLSHQLPPGAPADINDAIYAFTGTAKKQKWIGVSPFAQHAQKVYPLHKMENVVSNLAKLGYKLFIFGGSAEEAAIAEEWAAKYEGVISVVRKVRLEDEIRLISHLNLMVSMDSAGMHIASLVGIPTVSIWGATHPYAGFMGYGQSDDNAAQIDLECRPCSVYGNKPCFRGDHACMNNLPEILVLNKILEKL